MTETIDRDLLNTSATIRRNTPVSLGRGRYRDAFANLATAVPCRRRPAGGREITQAEQEKTRISDVFYFLPTVDVRRTDQIVIGSDTWEVTMVLDPSELHHRKVGAFIDQKGA